MVPFALICHSHSTKVKPTITIFSFRSIKLLLSDYPVSSIGWASNEILAMAVGDGHVLWTDVGGSDARIVTKVCFEIFVDVTSIW